jgi:S-layer protein
MTISSDIVNQVQQLYVAYFNRPADLGGLNYWASVIAAQGGSTAAVSAAFAKSPEYTTAFAGKSSYETVNQIYTNLFGRGAELGGLQYWGLLLDQGKITIDNAVTQIAAGAQGSDAIAYGNKVAAAGVFTTSLDSAGSALAYASAAAALVAKNFITSITDNASFTANTTPEAIATAVANLVTANESQSNTPQTLILTENFDAFGPTSAQQLKGNDTFVSNNPGTGDTFNAFDSLDGGAGADTIKISSSAFLTVPGTATVKNIETAQIQTASGFDGNVAGWTGLTKLTLSAVNGVTLTAADTTAVVLNESISGASTTTVTGGSTVTATLTTSPASVSGTTTFTGGKGALTYTHSGAQTGLTTLSNTTGNVTSTETGTTTGALTISGTTGNVVATRAGAGTGVINVTGTTGTVAVSNAGSADRGDITVSGGTTISVTQTATNDVNTSFSNGLVTVNGSASTTSVTVNNAAKATASATVAGVSLDEVRIVDINKYVAAKDSSATGTITSVTVAGFSTLSIADTALTTLNVTGGTSNIVIDNRPNVDTKVTPNVTAATAKTLGLTVNGQTGGTLSDQGQYTTLNVTTAGTANSTLALSAAALTALNVAGTKGLDIGAGSALAKVTTVTVTGAAGISGNFSDTTTNFKALTSISATGTGASTVTIDGSKTSFTGGAGADSVILSATASSKAIALGAGDDSIDVTGATALTSTVDGGAGTDTLKITAALAATASVDAAFAGQVTGFESLVLTGATNQTVDVTVLGNFNKVTTSGGNGLTLSNLPAGGTLILNAAGTAYTVSNSAFAGGASDTLNLVLTDNSGASVAFASTGITATNVENINITTVDAQATPSGTFKDSITLLGNSAKSIVVTGNAGLTLTATDTAATLVDASGITLGDFTWTSGALAANAVVKGTVAGVNTVDLTAAVAGTVTYTGGTAVDTVTLGTSTKAHTINLGGGTSTNSVAGGTAGGVVTVTSTSTGADTVTLGNGANVVNLGNGDNIFTAGSGNNTYTGGTGIDTVTVGAGQNALTLGTGNDIVTFSAVPTGVNTYSTILDAAKGDVLTVANLGTETFGTKISLASTAVFQDYANAVVAQGGNASVNGHFGWFQFTQTVGGVTSTDTYLVQSRHDGSGVNPAFVAGTDFIVKLTGQIDLAQVTGTGTNALTLG